MTLERMSCSANDQIFGAENYRPLVLAENGNGNPVQLGCHRKIIDGTENTRQADGSILNGRCYCR